MVSYQTFRVIALEGLCFLAELFCPVSVYWIRTQTRPQKGWLP